MPSSPSALAALHTLAFVREHLAAPPTRVLEVGCGDGDLAAELLGLGIDVVAIDHSPEAIENAQAAGVPAICIDFFEYDAPPFDAVLFSRVLHHLAPLDAAIERAARLLAPGGLLLVEDFAVERMDAPTARWFFETIELLQVAGMMHPKGHPEADPLARWVAHHAHHAPIHEGEEMLVRIGCRFQITHRSTPPYLFRYLCPRLTDDRPGRRIARWLIEHETRRVEERSLRAIGLRVAGRKAGSTAH